LARTHHGVVQGNTILFKRDLGLADGQQVEVVVHPLQRPDSAAMSLLRWTVSLVALVQIAVAIWWFASVFPNPKTGTVINLAILALLGLWTLRTRTAQRWHGFISLLNFFQAVMWGYSLPGAMGRVQDHAAPVIGIMVIMTLAIIIPCVINGIAVLPLPRRLGE
jgi:hypothetical protein